MRRPSNKTVDQFSPRQQRNWDWRAAANFIAGGSGGGLLLVTALSDAGLDVTRVALIFGMLLVAGGLTCVWFEIGQPWRALNVYRHFATSWMTREAAAALLIFAVGVLALFAGQAMPVLAVGLLGLVFLYCQARILGANKGIPSWRHPRSLILMVLTGVAEGAGFLVCILALSNAVTGAVTSVSPLLALLALIALRATLWRHYLAGLAGNAIPTKALAVLHGIDRRFLIVGHAVPALLLLVPIAGLAATGFESGFLSGTLLFVAGLLVAAGGWYMKFVLVRRAAFTQGIALQHLPVRGSGTAGAAVKPGWSSAI